MKLKRIEVESLRVFKSPLQITDLDPGLNLFAGRNGIGKSSLAAALRAAFFERAKSDKTKHLKPLDDPGASPRVSLTWDFAGTAYELTKEFAPKRRCTLVAGPQALDGEDAEDHLANLFGYTYAGKGLNRPDNLGVPGLLWIEQGSGQDLLDPVSFAGEQLKSAVASIAGVVASTSGDAVIDKLYIERDAFITRAQGRPTGDYAKVIAEAEAEAARLKLLEQEISDYRECVDDLAKVHSERKKLEAEKPWQAFDLQASDAKEKLESTTDLKNRIADQRTKLSSASKMLPLIEARITHLESAAIAFADAQSLVQAKTEELNDVRSAITPAAMAAEKAEAEELSAKSATELARSRAKATALRATIATATKSLSVMDDALTRAREAHQQRVELAGKLGGTQLKQADIDALRSIESKIREADIQIDAVGTRLQYEIDVSTNASLDGQTITGSDSEVIEVAAEFICDGVRLTIEPGGSDLAVLLDARTDSSNHLRKELDRHGVDSVTDLEARFQDQERLKNQDRLAEASLHNAAPNGLPALEIDRQAANAELQSAQFELSKLPESVMDSELSEDEANQHWEASIAASRSARDVLSNLRATEQSVMESLSRLQNDLSEASVRLNDPSRIDDLSANRLEQQKQASIESDSRERIKELETQLETAQPELLQADYERLTKSSANLRQRLTDLNLQAADLGGLAKGKGAMGLEEQLAESEVRYSSMTRRRDEIAHRVEVISYLLTKLESRKEQARQNLLEPLQKRVDHYIKMFMPDVNISLSDDMAPDQLTTAADRRNRGAFTEQSFGTREQLSLICRLAYADILQNAGRPTLIILDDALVHSDDDRLGSMKRVIYDAAARHQMLVFTCHASRWQDLGVPIRDFSEMVRAAA